MREQKNNGTTLLVALICAIGFISLLMGAFIFDEKDIKDAKAWVKNN